MKYLHVLSLLLLILFAACGDGRQQRLQLEELERMNRADSLMDSRPDSALQLLNAREANVAAWPESMQMRFRLLQAKARNKAYVLFTSDTVMQFVADYYDRHGTPNEQMEAHYLLGCVYRDLGETPKALAAYHDAVEYADTTAADCDYALLSRVHGQMAALMLDIQLPYSVLDEAQKAENNAFRSKDTIMAISCRMIMANAYYLIGSADSVAIISEVVSRMYLQHGDTLYSLISLKPAISAYLDLGKYAMAEKTLNRFEQLFQQQPNNLISLILRNYYAIKGRYCLQTNQIDSARHYYEIAGKQAMDAKERLNYIRELARYYSQIGKSDSAQKYAEEYVAMDDTVYRQSVRRDFQKMHSLYNYERHQRKAEQAEHEAERFRTTLIIVVALLVILILLSVIAFIRYQDEQQRLKERIEVLRGYAINQSLYDSPIAERFRQLLKASPYRHPDFNDWKELALLFDREIPDFRKALTPNDEPLSDFEYDVCMLTKIQISPSDIARIKQCKPSHITQTRKHIYEKRFSRKGKAYELDEFIMKQS